MLVKILFFTFFSKILMQTWKKWGKEEHNFGWFSISGWHRNAKNVVETHFQKKYKKCLHQFSRVLEQHFVSTSFWESVVDVDQLKTSVWSTSNSRKGQSGRRRPVENVSGRLSTVDVSGLTFSSRPKLIISEMPYIERSGFVVMLNLFAVYHISGYVQVVSIGSFWICFVSFSYTGVCFLRVNF